MLCKSGTHGQMVAPPTIKKVWMQRTSAEEINMHPPHPSFVTLPPLTDTLHSKEERKKQLKHNQQWTDDAWKRFGGIINTFGASIHLK